MPGYVIHLAIANEYLKNHTNKQENYNHFIEGVIYPDSVKNKSLTHYGQESSKTNLYYFLKENNLHTSFNRGYFLHLLTDYLFYNKYLEKISNDIYNDYDILNRILINKYNVCLPEKVKNQVFFIENGELKILSEEMVYKIIEEISMIDIDEIKKDIEENKEKWTKMRTLRSV